MKLLSINSVVIALVLCLHTAEAAPRVKNYTLQNHTTLVVNIVPNLGTRFVFPFVLDESDEYVPFTAELTNPAFKYKRDPGRNSFVVTIPPQGSTGQTANLYVTVAGYLITIELRVSSEQESYFSDINFELGNAERENLIQLGIKQRTKALEAEYKKKFDELNAASEKKAISLVGVLALTEPKVHRIKEESKIALTNGDNLVLYVDEALTYGAYTIFTFELSTDGDRGLSILDTKLFSIDPDSKKERPVDAAKDVPDHLSPGVIIHGVITTLDATLNPKEYLKLQVLTSKGAVEAKW